MTLAFTTWLQASAVPGFGPQPWLKSLAAAYEALHMPVQAVLAGVLVMAGYPGSLVQGWQTPEAQAIRAALFAANTYLLARMLRSAYLQRSNTESPEFLRLAESRLREWQEGGEFSGLGRLGRRDKEALDVALSGLESAIARPGEWESLLRARSLALGWCCVGNAPSRLWVAVGRATLMLSVAAQAEADPVGKEFGEACLRRAFETDPDDPLVWKALAGWGLLGAVAAGPVPVDRLPELEGIGLVQRCRMQAMPGGHGAIAALEALVALPYPSIEDLRGRAEILGILGRENEAFEVWRQICRLEPHDHRWWRWAHASADRSGIAEQDRKLPPKPSSVDLAPGWVLQFEIEKDGSRWLKQLPAGIALLCIGAGLVAAAGAILKPIAWRSSWVGRWTCSAIVSPMGDRIPMGQFPDILQSVMAEEACGYTSITALAPTAAFILDKDGGREIYLESLMPMRWVPSHWGVRLDVGGDAPRTLYLRPDGDGAELSIPGESWTLLFERDDRVKPVMNTWSGRRPPTYHTRRGTFADLGDRGWAQIAPKGMPLEAFEGRNSDLQPALEEEEAALASFSWGNTFGAATVYRAEPSQGPSQGSCYRPSERFQPPPSVAAYYVLLNRHCRRCD